MFKLTPAWKTYAVKNLGVKAGSADQVFSKAILAAIKAKKIDVATIVKLSKEAPATTSADAVQDAINKAVAAAVKAANKGKKPAKKGAKGKTKDGKPAKKTKKPLSKQAQDAVNAQVKSILGGLGLVGGETVTPEQVISGAAKFINTDSVRVKSAVEQYTDTKSQAVYPKRCGFGGDGSEHALAGQRATYAGIGLNQPSDRDKAIASAYFKFCLERHNVAQEIPRALRMTDHDRDLVNWSLRNMPWTGLIKGQDLDEGATKVNRRKLSEFEVKTLLDDSISGGIEAAPIAFDDAIILIPVLYGELFPLVNVVNVARGRRMKGAAMNNPTFTSGIAEGTAITPFNTASFVTAFDTTIYPAVAAMEIGLDFEEDSPVDLGNQIIENYGLKALEYLDRVIAVGDGVTEPQGFFNATGTTTVNSDNGSGGPATVSDYEGLMFGLPKQFRSEPGAVAVYVANDVMYRRACSIPVGPGDERRVFGMEHASYQILQRPYKINNFIPNGKVAFFNARRYRMYRRLGLNVRIETAGRTLALNNTKLIVLRMRFGGQLEIGAACAIMPDAQA